MLLSASFQPERFSQTQSGRWLFALCRTSPNHSAREGKGREAQQRHDTSGRRVYGPGALQRARGTDVMRLTPDYLGAIRDPALPFSPLLRHGDHSASVRTRLSVCLLLGRVFSLRVHRVQGPYPTPAEEASSLGSILSPCPLLASSPLVSVAPNPAFISWMERKEVWSWEAEDPGEGARRPGSGTGEESGAELEVSLSWE